VASNSTDSSTGANLSTTTSHIAELFDHFDVADQSLFKTVLSNSHHVLRRLLSKNKTLDLALTI